MPKRKAKNGVTKEKEADNAAKPGDAPASVDIVDLDGVWFDAGGETWTSIHRNTIRVEVGSQGNLFQNRRREVLRMNLTDGMLELQGELWIFSVTLDILTQKIVQWFMLRNLRMAHQNLNPSQTLPSPPKN